MLGIDDGHADAPRGGQQFLLHRNGLPGMRATGTGIGIELLVDRFIQTAGRHLHIYHQECIALSGPFSIRGLRLATTFLSSSVRNVSQTAIAASVELNLKAN